MTDSAIDAAGAPAPAPLPLQGIRVFDLTQGVAGPYCSMMLAAQGADVIKVEPFEGDWLRSSRQQYRGHAPAAVATNIGKRSLAIDLKQPDAQAVARRIAAGCHIVMESFRPGVIQRLGLGYDELSADRPGLVYASISGFGHEGPWRELGVIDQIMQAFSGWMSINADADGKPHRTRNIVVADQITGLYAYQALSSALIGQLRFGRGARLELSLIGAMAAFLSPRIVGHLMSGGTLGDAKFAPPTGEFPTRAGLLMLAFRHPKEFERFCAALARPELALDERFRTPALRAAHTDELHAIVKQVLGERTALEWEAHFVQFGVMASAVRTLDEFLSAPQTQAMRLVETLDVAGIGACPLVQLPGAPAWSARGPAPRVPAVGQHTVEILREAGCTADEIDAQLASDCIRGPRAEAV